MNLLGDRLLNLWRRAPHVTANVNLWPQMFAIIEIPTVSHRSATSSATR